jgi:thymidine kinase
LDSAVRGDLNAAQGAAAAEATDPHAPSPAGGAPGRGWIEVICGSMFSGKSEELIRRLRRAEIARQKVQVFKPRVDDRYDDDHIVSHSRQRLPSQRVTSSAELYAAVEPDTRVIGIDEAQFYDEGLVDICQQLAGEGRRVIVAGLDQDFRGLPFEPIPQLLAVAEYITKTLAICVRCGAPANRSQRLIASDERVVVGDRDLYEARCRACFDPGEVNGASRR